MPIRVRPSAPELSAAPRAGRRKTGRHRGPPHARGPRTLKFLPLSILALALIAVAVPAHYLANLAAVYETQTVTLEAAFPAEETRPRAAEPTSGAADVPLPGGPAAAMNFLLLGTDHRADSGTAARDGQPSDQRADTIMLVHLPADRSSTFGVSIMRDLWVTIPGHGPAKINAALGLGGIPLLVRTIETIFGQRVDHVAMVDFAGFKGLTDALGGVPVHVEVPFTSTKNGSHAFTAGTNVLNGDQALNFVRERFAFADGDYQRVRNQQAYLRGVLGKVLTGATLANPVTVREALTAVAPHLSIDSGLDLVTVGALAMNLRHLGAEDRIFFTLPTAGTGTSADGQSIVLVDPDALAEFRAALGADTLGSYVAATGLRGGN